MWKHNPNAFCQYINTKKKLEYTKLNSDITRKSLQIPKQTKTQEPTWKHYNFPEKSALRRNHLNIELFSTSPSAFQLGRNTKCKKSSAMQDSEDNCYKVLSKSSFVQQLKIARNGLNASLPPLLSRVLETCWNTVVLMPLPITPKSIRSLKFVVS